MKLGMNLRAPGKDQGDYKFSNLLAANGWAVDLSTGVQVPPESFTPPDFAAPGATPSVTAATHPATWGYIPAGDYEFRADGAGTLWFDGDFTFSGTPGQSHAWHWPGPATWAESSLYIKSVDPANPLGNLRFLGPPSDDTSFFGPAYLESLRGYKILRAMDWLIGVDNSANPYNPPPPGDFGFGPEITDWSQADPRPGRGPRGLCDLLLALKAVHGTSPDLHVNLPYRCAYFDGPGSARVTGYPQALGAYLAARVPPGTEVHVEYANEPWNYKIYDDYLVNQTHIGLTGSWRYIAYGVLSAACWEAFEAGFGRPCVRVLNGQYVWPDGNLVGALDDLKARGKRVDVIESAPYWWIAPDSAAGSDPIKAAWAAGKTSDALNLFFAALHAGIAEATKFMPAWQALASKYGVRNACYEGGLDVPKGWMQDADLGAVWGAAKQDRRLAAEVGSYLAAMEPYVEWFLWYMSSGGGYGAEADASDRGGARVNGLRAYNGLAPMDPRGAYPSDGFGSTGAGYVPTPPPAVPEIAWPDPAPVAWPAPLSEAHLNAAAAVPGTFVYTPPAGAVLGVGDGHPLVATFLPADQSRHAIATARAKVSVVPGPNPSGSAAFVGQDAASGGNWIGVRGADGYSVEGKPAALPPYAAATIRSDGSQPWAATGTDPRALQLPGTTDRTIGSWWSYVSPSLAVDLVISDAKEHDLALYFVDWDKAGRAQTVEVTDPGSGAVYDSRPISSFVDGLYLTYRVGGHVRITVTRTAGISTVLSGLFFGPAGTTTPTPTPDPKPDPTPAPTPVPATAGWSGTIAVKDGRIVGVTPG